MKKSRLKIATVIAVISILAVLFTACGKIDFTYVQRKDGTYQQIIDITFDEAQLTGTGYTVATAVPKLKTELEKEGYEVKTYSDNSARLTASRIFANLEDLKKNYLGNGLANDTPVTRKETFYTYQDVTGIAKISYEYISESANAWLIVKLIECNVSEYLTVADKFAEMDTSYNYATPYKSVESNADSVTKTSDGYYVHHWDLSENDTDIEITLSTVRGAVWYAVAIFAAVAAIAVFALVKVLGGKRKKNDINI